MQFCFVQRVTKLASTCTDSQIIIWFGYHLNSNIIPVLLDLGYLQWIFVVVMIVAFWFYDMDRFNDVEQQIATFG